MKKVKNEMNDPQLKYIIGMEMKELCKYTALNQEEERKNLHLQKQVKARAKTLKFLNKQRNELLSFFELNKVDNDELNFCRNVISSLDDFIACLDKKNNKKEQSPSPFHLFLSGNLFVTSLYVYGCLNDKNEKTKRNNEKHLLSLLEIDRRDKNKKYLDDFIMSALESNKNSEYLHEVLGGKNTKKIRNMTKGLMPSYDISKQLTGYRAALKRTLLDSKTVKFKDLATLNAVASFVTNWDYFLLLEIIISSRYHHLNTNPKATIELILEDNEFSLLTRTPDGIVKKKVLSLDIRKCQRDERDDGDYDYSEFDYED